MKCLTYKLLIVLIILCIATVVNSCGEDDDSITNGDSTPSSIVTGKWIASAEFGSFDIIVNNDRTAVDEIAFHMSAWKCGNSGLTQSGTVTFSRSIGWPISNRSISIDNNMGPFGSNDMLKIEGSFGNDGKSSSGTWNANVGTATCNGTWEASPE